MRLALGRRCGGLLGRETTGVLLVCAQRPLGRRECAGLASGQLDPIESGVIEIAIGAIVVRVIGRVDAETSQAVIEIVRRLACS